MIVTSPWVTGLLPPPDTQFAGYNSHRTSGNNTNPVTAGILPPFPDVTHRLWERIAKKRVRAPLGKGEIALMELSTCYGQLN